MGTWGVLTQGDESLEIVRRQGFLEPDHVVAGQHPRGFERPFIPVRPELIAAARVDHQFDIRSHRVSSELDETFVCAHVLAAEGSPAELERAKTPGNGRLQSLFESSVVCLEEEGAIGLDPVSVISTQKATHGLSAGFAQEVPQCDVDARNGVRDRAAPALPEGRLVEFFGDAFRFDGRFTDKVGFQKIQRGVHQGPAGGHASQPGQAAVRMHFQQRVQVFRRRRFGCPAGFRRCSHESDCLDTGNFHDVQWVLVTTDHLETDDGVIGWGTGATSEKHNSGVCFDPGEWCDAQYMESVRLLQQEIEVDWRISICQNGSSLVFAWSIRNRIPLSTGLIYRNMINSNMIDAAHSLRYECCMLYGPIAGYRNLAVE